MRLQNLCILILIPAMAWMAVPGRAQETGAWAVETRAVGGYNSGQVLNLVRDRVLLPIPIDIAIIMVGTNDALNSSNLVPVAAFRQNLAEMIRLLQLAGAYVMVAEPLPVVDDYLLVRHPTLEGLPNERVDDYVGAIAEVAAATSPTPPVVIPTHAAFGPHVGLTAASWIRNIENSGAADGVHPTPEGYDRLAREYFMAVMLSGTGPGVVTLFGDSITAGVWADAAHKPAARLEAYLNPNAARHWLIHE